MGAVHTLREERTASSLPPISQEDPYALNLEEDMTLNRKATGCTVATPKGHIENPLGGCIPGESISLSPDIAQGSVVGCTTTIPEPGQRGSVGCTTDTSPSYVEDSLQMGTVGCTTVTPLSLMEN